MRIDSVESIGALEFGSRSGLGAMIADRPRNAGGGSALSTGGVVADQAGNTGGGSVLSTGGVVADQSGNASGSSVLSTGGVVADQSGNAGGGSVLSTGGAVADQAGNERGGSALSTGGVVADQSAYERIPGVYPAMSTGSASIRSRRASPIPVYDANVGGPMPRLPQFGQPFRMTGYAAPARLPSSQQYNLEERIRQSGGKIWGESLLRKSSPGVSGLGEASSGFADLLKSKWVLAGIAVLAGMYLVNRKRS